MPDATVLKNISTRLAETPFSLAIPAVSLDELSWTELVDLLKRVAVHVFPAAREKCQDDATFMEYIIDQMHILNTDSPVHEGSLVAGVGQKNKEVLYDTLNWILVNFEATKLRAYLSQFLLPIDVPGEFADDENIVSLRRTHAELQQEFQRLHTELTDLQKTVPPVDAVKAELSLLDREKQQLAEKIANLKTRTSVDSVFASLLSVTSALRVQQEEEAKLTEKLSEQKHQADEAEKLVSVQGLRYETKRKQLEKFQSREFINQFRTEIERMERETNESLIEEEQLSKRLQQLHKSLSEPFSVGSLQEVESAVERLEAETSKLKQLIFSQAGQEHEADSKLSMFKQQATLAARKRENFERELKLELELLENAEAELKAREDKFTSMKGVKFVAKSDFKQYAQALRDKTAVFKRLQPELRGITAEATILARTEQILGEQLKAKGFTSEELSTSVTTSSWSGSSSDALARDLGELNAQLKHKKLELTPQLKALKQVRQEFDLAAPEYVKQKLAFEDRVRPVMSRLKQVGAEAMSVDDRIMESRVKARECSIEEAIIKREGEATSSKVDEIFVIQSESEAELSRLKTEILKSRERQAECEKQKKSFNNLKHLIDIKLTSVKTFRQEALRGYQGKNILQM